MRSALFNGVIVDIRGPFFSSGNWWENNRWWREEWDIQTADGNLYRIFRAAEEVGETVGRACCPVRVAPVRTALAPPTTALDSNAHAPSPQSSIEPPHSPADAGLRAPEEPQKLRQVLECGVGQAGAVPLPLSSETDEHTQSSESFTADSGKLLLTPCFSGVHERPVIGINCFNSFPENSRPPHRSRMSDAPLSQSNPLLLHYFIEGIYD